MMLSKPPVSGPGDLVAARAEEGFALPTFRSGDLFAGASEIGISHDGALYRLRITRTGKLILTK